VGTTSGFYHGDIPNGFGTVVLTDDADALTTHAYAYTNGWSSACSGALSGTCGQRAQPLTLALNLRKLAELAQYNAGNYFPFASLDSGLGTVGLNALNNFTIVLGITGPSASCTAGPADGPRRFFSVSRTVVSGTADLQYNGKSVIGGPVTLGFNGDALAALTNATQNFLTNKGALATQVQNTLSTAQGDIGKNILQNQQVQSVLQGAMNAAKPEVTVSATPGSDSGTAGSSTSASVGSFTVTVNSIKTAAFTGGKVSCGENQRAAG
jgi:hypothetical protein